MGSEKILAFTKRPLHRVLSTLVRPRVIPQPSRVNPVYGSYTMKNKQEPSLTVSFRASHDLLRQMDADEERNSASLGASGSVAS